MTISQARADYEADRAETPLYHDKQPRPAWEQLSPIAQWSWQRAKMEAAA